MKHLLIILFLALLTACAGQQANIEAKQKPKAPEDDTSQHVVAEKKEHESQDSLYAQEVLVTGDRLNRASKVAADSIGMPMPSPRQIPPQDRENYHHFDDMTVQSVFKQPISTFSIDVDTGSYANMRRFLNNGQLPRKDAVRTEELINYFSYDYDAPDNLETPFASHIELAPSPWNKDAHLLHIGLKGYEVPVKNRPAANLVFLLDVSGSMNSPDKIGLLKSALKLLSRQLNSDDRVSIAVYAGAAGTVLEPTPGNNQAKIAAALDQLSAGGSTHGSAGIHLAYQLAEQSFIKDGINRILIATDGDFNVGTTNFEALKELVEKKREQGVSLTTLGFGTGNYNDHLMEQLADVGNGNYAYIDTIKEANKVLVEQMNGTLLTIAKDVKIQLEFNPNTVSEYRLIGYENRQLNEEDFNNDKVDAGDIGAGHTVTAIYEIVLKGNKGWLPESRYQTSASTKQHGKELAYLKIRYKKPDSDTSQLLTWPIEKNQIKDLNKVSDAFGFSAAVAGFGQQLRGGTYLKEFGYDAIRDLANQHKGNDAFGYRGEFVQLVSLAKSLDNQP
jgi:Ca-activated chloride channel family protein